MPANKIYHKNFPCIKFNLDKHIMKNSKQDSNKTLVKKYFDDVSQDYSDYQYSAKSRSYMSVRQDKMLRFFTPEMAGGGKKILDAGCGSGQLMSELARKGYDIYGMDMSHEMLGLTRNKINEVMGADEARLISADIESIPFHDNTFDVVTTAGVIEYLKNDDKVLYEFHRVLKDNGILVISITNKYSYNLMLDGVYEYFRSKPLFFKIMNFVSSKIVGHGELQPKKFIIRRHKPYAFKQLLEKNGFDIVNANFFYYNLLPHPFNSLLFSFGSRISKKLDILDKTKLKIFGEGYLLICRKIST